MGELRRAALSLQQRGSPLMEGTAKGTGLWGAGWSWGGWGSSMQGTSWPDCPHLCRRRREAEAEWRTQQSEAQVQDVCLAVNVVMLPKSPLCFQPCQRRQCCGENSLP